MIIESRVPYFKNMLSDQINRSRICLIRWLLNASGSHILESCYESS